MALTASSVRLREDAKRNIQSLNSQLEVLEIVDSSGAAWPGVRQCVERIDQSTEATFEHLQQTEATCTELQGQVASLKQQMEKQRLSAEATLKDLQMRSDEAATRSRTELDRLNRVLDEVRHEREAARERLEDSEAHVVEVEARAVDLESHVTELDSQNVLMQGELEAVMAQSSKLTDQLERCFQEAATQRETLSDTQMALDMAEADLTAAQDQVKIGEKRMESIKAENAELRRSHAKQRQQSQQKLNACNREVERLQNWKEWAEQASIKQLELEKAAARELMEKLSEAEAEGARRMGEVRQLQETVWVERTRAAELKVELASSQRSSEQLQAELAAAAEAVAKSRQDATEASMETARVEARLEIDRFRALEKEHRMNRDLHVRKALSAAWEREAKLLGKDEASKHQIVPLSS